MSLFHDLSLCFFTIIFPIHIFPEVLTTIQMKSNSKILDTLFFTLSPKNEYLIESTPRKVFIMDKEQSPRDFPIVCVGGSAGGLDSYTRLLKNLPADMGVAIVIVNHLRTVATLLHEILPRYTKMPVTLITEKLDIRPNQVFIIPERCDLHVDEDEFRLKPISKPHGWPDVITVFLHSLSQNWDGKIIAVIVSGYDGDGAAALKGIKEVGGITIAQKPETATQPDMPESAIDTGYIDFILSPEDIAKKIIEIA